MQEKLSSIHFLIAHGEITTSSEIHISPAAVQSTHSSNAFSYSKTVHKTLHSYGKIIAKLNTNTDLVHADHTAF